MRLRVSLCVCVGGGGGGGGGAIKRGGGGASAPNAPPYGDATDKQPQEKKSYEVGVYRVHYSLRVTCR